MATLARIPRTCLIGPESTGKTALAQALARHFNAEWVPEYAREYVEGRGNRLSYQDVEPIARGEIALLNGAGVILDTDLISTVVYSRHYYGRCPEWIVEEVHRRRADLYLLMDTDLLWRADSARDAGGEEREDLFDQFRRALDEFETRWTIISGDREERLKQAILEISSIDRQIGNRS
jgi:HTH-type transcriptional repressor of NAD biosynthesis genes